MSNDYSLPFLSELGPEPRDEDVEQMWRNRVFPLVFTDDFASNWSAVRDPKGMFVAPSGSRCRVEPRPHHAPQCLVVIQQGDMRRQERVSYEAIIFSKVVHQMFLNRQSKDCTEPAQVQRRKFIDHFVRKLPKQWRTLIILGDLHYYKERNEQIPWFIKLDIYSSLADPKNIRLITLQASDDYNALIKCTLFEVDRTSAPEYEALSYVWGAPGSTRNILLNGKMIPIRENLEAALRELRRREDPRTLWIDGICIDQSNVEERTDQVKRMDTTYRNAAGVVVWIGRESNTSARLFDKSELTLKNSKQLDSLLRSEHFLDFPFQPEDYCPLCDGVPHKIPSQLVGTYLTESVADRYTRAAQDPTLIPQQWKNEHTEDIEAFVTLLRRPWWRRVWVLQEAILAKKITLHCGPRSMDWPIFQGILYTLVRQGKRSRIHHTGGLTTEARRARAQAQLLFLANSTFAFFFLQSSLLATKQLRGLSMADLLSLTSNFDATDPRDKVFALIGLLPENSPERVQFKPDYSINVKQLFINVAKSFLETDRRLDVVTARPSLPSYLVPKSRSHSPDWDLDCPSWVPNWKLPQLWYLNSIWISKFSQFKTLNWYTKTRISEHEPGLESVDSGTLPEESLQVFNASLQNPSPFPFEFSGHGEILHAHGVTVDTVEEVGKPWDLAMAALKTHNPADPGNSNQNAHDAQVAIIEQWKTIARLNVEGQYSFTQQSRSEAFWRTLFLDRYRSTHTHERVYRVTRIPVQVGDEEANNIFGPAGITCGFPPETSEDELGLIYFLRHEATEMGSFTNINLHCVNLSLFRTVKGYIGVGHPNMRPGDKVALLLGAAVPLVLREYDEGHLLIGQRFASLVFTSQLYILTFTSNSYVHGIMDGEYLQAERDQGRGTKREDFEAFAII
ncbi:hypothetical protein Aspvir_009676 [Aspergillus viridinutans]|uniref:Heterokaryon incompatibility domain-containing protein n=1 Tax=Aspergillus viridinutans TaxID=75553 RepID=A0A9P3F8L7_ASPVI|nr:uncharacterized protein Aspvir_009676 [Aspergillus viridinutans]GIK05563.1 hypothetical protein Aspvir_009676 [Aspergillus viridinutans]